MKIVLALAFFANIIFASVIQNGENLKDLKVNDQFDKQMIVKKDIEKIIVAFSKQKGAQIKEFLDKNPNYLESNKALYFADVSAAPSFVTNLFMIPKFKDYSYKMGLIRDEEFAKRFPKKDDKISIINIKEFVVTNIEFKDSIE